MIKVNSVDLDNLIKLGTGKCATVYKKDEDTAYKIYHLMVAEDNDTKETMNPMLFKSPLHFKSLINRNKKLKHTDTINDIIYVDGLFRGVCLNCFKGMNGINLLNAPFELKINISEQLIRNAKELIDNNIYHLDFKLKNLIVSNGIAHIVDLDDKHTFVCYLPSLLLRSLSISSLAECIHDIFQDKYHLNVPTTVSHKLERTLPISCHTFKTLNNYLDGKRKPKNILFIDSNSDIDTIKQIKEDFDFKPVYIYEDVLVEKRPLLDLIDSYNKEDINLYDITKEKFLDDYPNTEYINESYYLKEKKLFRTYKK